MSELNTPTWVLVAYLVAAVCFIVALKGLSSPKSARRGNLIGAAGAILGVGVIFVAEDFESTTNLIAVIAAVVVGTAMGVPAARMVKMTQMPQMVALFNGVGGGAAALVAVLELAELPSGAAEFTLVATAFTLLVGSVSFAGSCVTFAKLQELMTSRPVVFPGLPVLFGLLIIAALALSVLVVIEQSLTLGIALIAVGLVGGAMLVLPVGGADVPIVISLLNAFTGLAVAAGGYVLGNTLLLVAGTLVGAAGTILTKLMAQGMGRSVMNTMFGALKGGSTLGSAGETSDRPVKSGGPQDVAILLAYADRVIIVPGYGLAVAQAQHTIQELVEVLQDRGIEVDYAIHPVAGRMPGHMNVLLAEANVPYENLKEMDDINPEFKNSDVTLVVGANDVVNPAAKTSQGSPIYGMPILSVDESQQIIFLKRSMRPGFAGIENELMYDPKTTLLFGDAKDSLAKVLSGVKEL